MGGLLILILIGLLWSYWYVFAALFAVWAVVCIADTLLERGAAERADRARHRQARREIDAVTVATARAMRQVAREHQKLTDSTRLGVRL